MASSVASVSRVRAIFSSNAPKSRPIARCRANGSTGTSKEAIIARVSAVRVLPCSDNARMRSCMGGLAR